MARLWQLAGQAAAYLLVALLLGNFSQSPAYTHFPPDRALIKLSFTHAADRKEACRRRTAEELAELAPNMRKPLVCTRERQPVLVELLLDGQVLYRDLLPPSGLSGDGPSRVYRRFTVEPGPHRLAARLRDSARDEGYDYVRDADIDLAPRQNLVVDFHAEAGGFVIK